MNRQLLSNSEIDVLLDSVPEFQLFHVKPLKEQYIIIDLLITKFKDQKSIIKTKRSKGYFNTKKLLSKNSKRLNEISFLVRYCKNVKEVLLQEAIDTQEFSIALPSDSIAKYRNLSKFVIKSESDLLNIKGYNLLQTYGWYSKTNPNGLVKDHRVSVKYGYENKINPDIIGHLANCELLPFRTNAKKSSNCSISLDQLLIEITNYLRIV